MTFQQLLDGAEVLAQSGNPSVSGLEYDSRRLKQGDVFVAMIKQELLLPFIGGVFVIEALSVILQVTSYKLRKKRIFKMAPIHHHFELLGWSESKIIVRFWIASLIFALFALTTLKLR